MATRAERIVPSAAGPHNQPVSILVIDFDDTLFQLQISWVEVLCGTLAAACGQQDGDRLKDFGAWIGANRGLALSVMVEYAQAWIPSLCRTPADELRRAFDNDWRRVSDQAHTMDAVTPGMRELLVRAAECGVPRYVLTGGDVKHKRQLIDQVPLRELITLDNIIGDGDSRMGNPPRKTHALRAIWNGQRYTADQLASAWAAFVCDGTTDFAAAKECGFTSIGIGPNADQADYAAGVHAMPWQRVASEILNLDMAESGVAKP